MDYFRVGETLAALGEGPVWVDGELLFVDIVGRRVLFGERVFDLPEMVGCAWPCAGGERFICGLESGFVFLDCVSGEATPLADPEAGVERTRFNDGKCDPSGRFWAGTMDMEEREALGSLYMVGGDGVPVRQWSGVTVSNGMAWAPDGRTFYYVDSPTREVAAFDYDELTGALSGRRVVYSVPEGEGFPDGMTIDVEGMLWVALWGGWGVLRIDPRSGERLGKVELPVEKVTSCCFGGEGWDELYVTTARVGVDVVKQPLAGGVFRVEPGVCGVATVPFTYLPGVGCADFCR